MATFLITAGHSNSDPGAVANGKTEAELVTELRNLVITKLVELGHYVTSDGVGSINNPLSTAVSRISSSNVANVEFHLNAFTNLESGGVEVISLPKDRVLSMKLAKSISTVLGLKLRGDRGWIDQAKSARGRLAFVSAGGIIVETFFLSNPTELDKYLKTKYLVAGAIANCLHSHATGD